MAARDGPVLMFWLLLASLSVAVWSVTYTEEKQARGPDVVCSTISRIRDTANDLDSKNNDYPAITNNDNEEFIVKTLRSVEFTQFLRRLAYVETLDGIQDDTFESFGGIWQINEEFFLATRDIPFGDEYFTLRFDIQLWIEQTYSITWAMLSGEDLQKPLHSALAAAFHLLITLNGTQIPTNDVNQAAYWKMHYNSNGTEATFTQRVEALATFVDICSYDLSGCRIKADIVFVLDSSGSIVIDDYEIAKGFIANFTKDLTIGPDDTQVAVVIFGSLAEIVFDLDTYTTQEGLQEGIESIPYLAEATNTGAGLQKLIEVFTSSSARMDASVLHLGIVLTDGQSNRGDPVDMVAGDVSRALPETLVYAIGVGNYNLEELEIIATSPEYVSLLESFSDQSGLDGIRRDQTFRACYTAVTPVTTTDVAMGTVEGGGEARFGLSYIPPELQGFTIRLCVQQGQVVLYVSTDIVAPNEAHYNWKITVGADLGCQDLPIFVDQADGRKKRQAVLATNITSIFIRIEGLDLSNSYTLETMEGVQPVACDPPCENGVCIANDTCNCDIGFDGALCNDKFISECETNTSSSLCLNGGTCYWIAYTILRCECDYPYFGQHCENIGGTGTPPNEGNHTDEYNLTVIIAASTAGGGAFVLILLLIVIITIAARVSRASLSEKKASQKIAKGYEKMDKKLANMYEHSVPEAITSSGGLVMKNPYLPTEGVPSAYALAVSEM